MPWCPKCKNEYREGITVCSDCGCELVEKEADSRKTLLLSGPREEMEALAEFLRYGHIEEVEVTPVEGKEACEVIVPDKELKKAERLAGIYIQQKRREQDARKELAAEAEELREEEETPVKPAALYENSASKAEDNKSSAYTLLAVGIVGMIVVILGIADVLPLYLSGTTKYMTYGIMSALFLLFIVMGLTSMKSYRIFAKKAESENSLRDTIEKWCLETLEPEKLDAALFTDEESVTEEEKYFKRTSLIKEKIKKQFLNLDEAFLDNFVDDIYEDIFEEEK